MTQIWTVERFEWKFLQYLMVEQEPLMEMVKKGARISAWWAVLGMDDYQMWQELGVRGVTGWWIPCS